jgi:hypothetical protein
MRTRKITRIGQKIYEKVDFTHTKAFRAIPARPFLSAQKKLDFLIQREVEQMFDSLTVNNVLTEKGQVNAELHLTERASEMKPVKVTSWITRPTKKTFEKRGSRWITHLREFAREKQVSYQPYPQVVWR